MSRPAARDKRNKRKVKRIIESSESEEEETTSWNLRDDPKKGLLKFTIAPATAAKWKEADSKERARHEKKPPIAPMIVNKDLSEEAVFKIGETLNDEIDAGKLKTNFDLDAIDFEHISKAPGVTDAQIAAYEATCKQQKSGIDLACEVPLRWFMEVMSELPLRVEVLDLYIEEVKELAINTAAASFRDIWKHCIIVYALRKQDVADYLWHAQKMIQEEEEGNASKQQRTE